MLEHLCGLSPALSQADGEERGPARKGGDPLHGGKRSKPLFQASETPDYLTWLSRPALQLPYPYPTFSPSTFGRTTGLLRFGTAGRTFLLSTNID